MKKILVYGDSNVWGDNFLTGERIPDDKQWINILREKIGDKYIIYGEGLPGRIAGNDEVVSKHKNGKDTFISSFRSNAPVDVLIVSLGTNDLQTRYNKFSSKIIEDLLWYRNVLEDSFSDLDDRKKYFGNKKIKIIYILPINFDYKKNASVIFDYDSEVKRQEIISYFLNSGIDVIYSNDMDLFDDGIHLSFKGHRNMANMVMEVIENE